MAKAKKRPVRESRQSSVQQPNRFELLDNKKKFNVLGKRSKGDVRSRVQSRSNAVDKRKATLLVEHTQRQRANAFLDRRFGEDDSSLTADDRAIARFQKQRLNEFSGSKYHLEDPGEGEQLTHLGAALGDTFGDVEGFSDGVEDVDLDHNATGQLHFGGGFTRKDNTVETDAQELEPMKSKKEVMAEIIAKSKKARFEKTKQREEDLDAVDKLDENLAELVKNESFRSLIRPKGAKPKASATTDPNDAAFDIARRELIFEAKAKVGERTKTAQELEEAEAARLQALERQRRAKMSGDDLGEEMEAEEGLPAGGYARKRAKKRKLEQEAASEGSGEDSKEGSGSDSEASSMEEDSEEGRPLRKKKLSLDARRQQRAAGDHPLQQRFKELSGALLKKHVGGDSDEEGEDDDTDEKEEDNKLRESDEEDASVGEGSEDGRQEDEGEEEVEDEVEEEEENTEKGVKHLSALREPKPEGDRSAAIQVSSGSPEDELPFVIAAPKTYEEFSSLVEGRSEGDLRMAVRRIRVTNRAALAAEGKRGLQVLYGILVQHFANLAGESPPQMHVLDVLTVLILEITPEVPLYAATVALARLKSMHKTLSEALQDPDSGSCWPSQRQLLLFKLWGTIFQAADRRHPVLTPATLVVGACLSLSPVSTWEGVFAGLFLSAFGLQISAAAARLMPEPLLFALNLLQTLCSQCSDKLTSPRGWSVHLAPESKNLTAGSIVPLSLGLCSRAEGREADLAVSSVTAALGLVQRAAEVYKDIPSFPEMFAPAVALLKEVHGLTESLPQAMRQQCSDAQKVIEEQCQRIYSSRQPMQRVKVVKEIKQFNPRFEEDFAQEKDYDVDRERADARKLKRMVSKERRGAMRELRKDAAFMGAQNTKEKEDQRASSKKTLRANSAWLQKLEQDFKSGGQGGMWKRKKSK